MNKNDWENSLGKIIRQELNKPYEGLPTDEPKFNLYYLNQEHFLDLQSKVEIFYGL